MPDYSTQGLTLDQRRVLAGLPGTMRARWVHACRVRNVVRVQPNAAYPNGGWQMGSIVAPSALELLEVAW